MNSIRPADILDVGRTILRMGAILARLALGIWVLPTAGLLAIALVWRFSEGQTGFAVVAAALSFVFAAAILVSGRDKHPRAKIPGLATAYLFTAIGFGAIYHLAFLRVPYAFSFSSSITEGKSVNEFQEIYQELCTLNTKLYLLGLAEAHLPSCAAAAADYSKVGRNWYPLGDQARIAFLVDVVSFGPAVPYMQIQHNGTTHTYGEGGFSTSASLVCTGSMSTGIFSVRNKL